MNIGTNNAKLYFLTSGGQMVEVGEPVELQIAEPIDAPLDWLTDTEVTIKLSIRWQDMWRLAGIEPPRWVNKNKHMIGRFGGQHA
jgi:hypothetical protein